MAIITRKILLSLFLVLFGSSAFALASCPIPLPQSGPQLITFCQAHAGQFGGYYSCLNYVGNCMSGGAGGGGHGSSGRPANCSQYATTFCGTSNQHDTCWQSHYSLCMG